MNSKFDRSHLASGIGLRIASSTLVTGLSSAFIFGIQILQLAVLSRLLSPGDFGIVGMAMVATGFVQLFADVGLATATVQRNEIDQAFVSALFYIDLIVAFGLMLVCGIMAPVAANLFSEPRVTPIILVIALTFPLNALGGQHRALLSRRMLYLRFNFVNVASNAIGAAVAILCAWHVNLGYWSLVIGTVATTITTMVLSWVVSPWLPLRPGSLEEGKSALKFGINLLGANLAGWFWKQADRALLGWRWNAAELGYYMRAYSLLMVPIALLSGPIGAAIIPALSHLQNDKAQWTALMLRVARAMAFFAGLLTLVLTFNAELIIRIVLGPEWGYSVGIFSFLALSLFPGFVWEHARFVFISLGRTDAMRRYAVAAAIVHMAAFSIGVAWGSVGVAISLAVASALVTPPLLVVSARVAGIAAARLALQFIPSFVALLAVAALAHALSGLFDNPLNFGMALAKSAALALAYLGAHLVLLPLHGELREDVLQMRAFAKKILAKRFG